MENRNWVELPIKDVAVKLTSGGTPSTKKSEYYENGDIPWLNTKEVDYNRITSTEKYITEEGLKNSSAKWIEENSVIVAMYGATAAKTAITKIPLTTNQACCNIIVNHEVCDYEFLFYNISNKYSELENIAVGAAQQNLSVGVIGNFILKFPPLPEQKVIASVLSSLDDKIDLLHQQNQTLEALAETLFRQWFINYSENQNEPKKETEIGNVPESFKVVQIKDLDFVLETGKRPKGGVGTLTSGVPSIGAENIKGLGMYDHSKTKYISQEFADKMNRGHIKGYELLIYKDGGTPGHFIPRYSIFGNGFPFDTMTINEHVFKLDFNDKAFNFFCYFYFQTDLVDSILVANGAKAAIPGINQDDVKNLWIIHPETPIIKKFGDLTLPYLEKILFNCNQIQTLTQLRDTLLPKLMSGEVRVKV